MGQRQLICMARALLRKPRILILDEAAASVDIETDNLIQQTIRQQFSQSTLLIIAHRIQTIMDCDRVMVLDNGLISEFDTPLKLINTPESIFRSLALDSGIQQFENTQTTHYDTE